MAPTTPMGSRRVKASLPSPTSAASIGTISPASLRASTAANVNVLTARAASTRAVFSGLAASAAMVRAKSSTRSLEEAGGGVEDLGPLPLRERCAGERLRAGGNSLVDVGGGGRCHGAYLQAVVGRAHDDGLGHAVAPYPFRRPVLRWRALGDAGRDADPR